MKMPVTSRLLESVEGRDDPQEVVQIGVDRWGRRWGYVQRNVPVVVDYGGNAVTWGFNVCVMEKDVWCYVAHSKTEYEALTYVRDYLGYGFNDTTVV